jgi:hypothetical protein
MPACPGGAVRAPGAPDQGWLDVATFVAAVAANVVQPIRWAIAAYAASLVSIDSICAQNPDPPEPLTALDIIESTASIPTAGAIGENKVFQYVAKWLVYDLFLRNCDCVGAPPPSGGACPYTNASWSLPSGAATGPVTYDIPQASYDAWPSSGGPPTPDYKPVYQLSFTTHSVATTQHFLEWSSDQVVWHPFIELPNTSSAAVACQAAASFIPGPKPPRTGFIRAHNNSAVTFAVTGFSFCFCTLVSTPPPNDIPVRDPNTPDKPVGLCSTDDICAALNDVNRKLIALQELVTLMQRFSVPFGVIPGTVHTGLSGRGSFTIDRLIGLSLVVTAHTPSRPDLEGNPAYVWDQGWVSVVDGDGLIQEKRVSQTRLTWLPSHMALGVTVGYDFRPGTVVDVTELHAEP